MAKAQDRTSNPKSGNSLPACAFLMSFIQRSLDMVSKKYICDYCRVEFIPIHKHNANKFCSKQCYWGSKKKKVTRLCIECGNEYLTIPTGAKKFCSRECFHKNKSRNSVDIPCMTCGEIVHKWKSTIHPSGNVYCSRECATEAIKKPGWRKKYQNTSKYKLNRRIRNAIRRSIKGNKNGRRWEDLVGYTLEQLKKHLEKQFYDGMTWEKFFKSEIHIDHKIPIAVHNFEKPEDEDFKRCWALKNLQPLWAQENLSKHAKITKPFQPSLIFG